MFAAIHQTRETAALLWHTVLQHEIGARIAAHSVEYFCECGRRWSRTR